MPKNLNPDRTPGHVTISEAAKTAGVTMGTIKWWIKEGRLPPTAVHESESGLLIRKADLRKAIKGRRRAPSPRHRDLSALSPNEAAEVLNVTGEAVKQWIYSGTLPATKLPNGYWRIKHEDLKAYLELRQNLAPAVYVATTSAALADRLSALAKALGYQARTVSTTAEALKQFPSVPANLLVVDLGTFPDAWKLIRKVRSTSYFGSPKILLAGGEALDEKETGEAVRLGINGCLVGEVTVGVLGAEVRALLGKSK